MKKWQMAKERIQTGDRIVVGLSGGGDSVCLLCLLNEMKEEKSLVLTALHVHHGIRGKQADEDAAFCAGLCEDWQIPLEIVYVDVPSEAKRRKQSEEETARILRYEALENCRRKVGAEWIAVAHHRDDNAETVLWNLFRGSGLRGLSGMQPVNGHILRPLLAMSRSEIEAYLTGRGLSWRTDQTNEEDHYTRNRIRHHILGYAEHEINSQAAEHICRTAAIAAQADAYLRRQAQHWLEIQGIFGEKEKTSKELKETEKRTEEAEKKETAQWAAVEISVSALIAEEEILQTYIIRELLNRFGGLVDVTYRHEQAVRQLLCEYAGQSALREVTLAGRIQVSRSYDRLLFCRQAEPEEKGKTALPILELSKEIGTEPKLIQIGGYRFEISKFPYEKSEKIPTNRYTKWLDYDKIERTLVFRPRQTGDYFFLKDNRRKTVKSFLIDEKIPADKRDKIPMVTTGNHVLWIPGYRLSEQVKVTNATKIILQMVMYGGEEDGNDSRVDSRSRRGQEDQ